MSILAVCSTLRHLPIIYFTHISNMSILIHYGDVIMGAIASQITSLTIVYPTVYSDTDQRKHQSSASLAFVRGNFTGDRWIFPAQRPVTRRMFPLDDVIMEQYLASNIHMNCALCVYHWSLSPTSLLINHTVVPVPILINLTGIDKLNIWVHVGPLRTTIDHTQSTKNALVCFVLCIYCISKRSVFIKTAGHQWYAPFALSTTLWYPPGNCCWG